ncbi:hypothetical protein [Christensenella tenuis]|uniref:Uncharacterized protein n=1 Tax=Christensenella tenuis TaxID=2763033 RepID=A0ABR7EHB0_9FIRM|nr:hypothetical protein [Christensenella tenuis]MBC5649165.1 hypothetical protein [Christensenella tenuis]
MKKPILGIAIAVTLLLGACALTPADHYDNFINDLDAVTRLQTGLQQMEGGGMTPYVTADMKTLGRELAVFSTEDTEIRQINENFISTARALRESMEIAEEDEEAAHALYEAAKTYFDTGLLMFSSLETSGGGRASG